MLGFYNYTMYLTYLSLASAATGIIISLTGVGHPFIGAGLLLVCGLCDAFDGKVARTKKERSELECRYGIQLDSLSDVVAFGVLPTCVGAATVMRSSLFSFEASGWQLVFTIGCFVIMVLYVLAAMIRLAYFNVTEEDRQKEETCARKSYTGIPVTLGSLMLPPVLILQYIFEQIFTVDLTYIYFIAMLLIAIGYVSKFRVPKPGLRGIIAMSVLGCAETVALIVSFIVFN